MIARMSKYNFVLYATQSDDFIDRVRELGLVDITTTGWEPSEEDRDLILNIESLAKIDAYLNTFKESHECDNSAEPFTTAYEAYEFISKAVQQKNVVDAEIARLEKSADELQPWGDFSTGTVATLAEGGIVLRYFSVNKGSYDKNIEGWGAQYTISLINEVDGVCYFIVVAYPNQEVAIDAQEMKSPSMDIREVRQALAVCESQLKELEASFVRAISDGSKLKEYDAELKERLDGVRIKATAQSAVDGYLVVMEGWAERSTSTKFDALLEEYPNIIYIKSDPTPDDDIPVKLKNNRFFGAFEAVGDMYARPKYGTLDITAFAGPFYMLFFAICLNDAGYGLILTVLGAIAAKMSTDDMVRKASIFATYCGVASIIFGLLSGSIFGVALVNYLPNIPFLDFEKQFFTLALAIGVVHIILGMILKVVMTVGYLGAKYAMSAIGWLLVVASSAIVMGLPMLNQTWVIPHFTSSSPLYYGIVGVGAFMMFFLNSPGKNPLLNFGIGLWDTYNNVTGILGDVLSYIRLFAIGLAGAMLATVFNTLAVDFSDGLPIVAKILVMSLILILGHGMNLMMSLISSFVHPMRLTFVEFYKNAGFDVAPRNFTPLEKLFKK